jgi:hypothetical protein
VSFGIMTTLIAGTRSLISSAYVWTPSPSKKFTREPR